MSTMLADVVTRLFSDLVTKELIEAAEKGEWPAALWNAVEENGLTQPLVPENRGGAGITWRETYDIVRAAGRHAVPLPIAETVVASALLSGAGIDVPPGPLTIAPVHAGDRVRITRDGSSWKLSGTATRVPWGAAAGHVVVVANANERADGGGRDGGDKAMIALAGGARAVESDSNLALEPRDNLDLATAHIVAVAPAPAALPGGVIRLYGAMLRSAQMAGGLEYLLSQTTRYAGERKQFGKPIGAFQAIQHNLAIVAGHTAAAGMAAAHAFRAADKGDPFFEIAAAKVRVGEAAGICAGLAHQVHGAIGFTYEHSLHFVTRRLWSWRAEFGGEGEWAAELGRDVALRGADSLWAHVTSR